MSRSWRTHFCRCVSPSSLFSVLTLFFCSTSPEIFDLDFISLVLCLCELFLGIPAASLNTINDKYFYFHHTNADTMTVLNSDEVRLEFFFSDSRGLYLTLMKWYIYIARLVHRSNRSCGVCRCWSQWEIASLVWSDVSSLISTCCIECIEVEQNQLLDETNELQFLKMSHLFECQLSLKNIIEFKWNEKKWIVLKCDKMVMFHWHNPMTKLHIWVPWQC